MAIIRIRPSWHLPPSAATPERLYLGRRTFLQAIGAGAGLLLAPGCARADKRLPPPTHDLIGAKPTKRNGKYVLDRPITDEKAVVTYNNFYEFSEDKEDVAPLAQQLTVKPWAVALGGLVKRPRTLDVAEMVKRFPLEERLYRHRCVEAWAMAVPWIGFPLRALVEFAEPLPSAKFVRFVSFQRPEEAPGQRTMKWYPWPYFEGLTMAEATCDLAFCAVGLYGHDLPKQNGAPLRIVVPWKYGYKSAKSIVKVEFTASQPATFWNEIAPREYDFTSNVNPAVPHPRWSQASERMLGTGERRPTLPWNGYGELVASLYR